MLAIIIENEIANCYVQHVSYTHVARGPSPHIQASPKNFIIKIQWCSYGYVPTHVVARDIVAMSYYCEHALTSTEQELALSLPLPLSPTENEVMNRISSSIIRELSSNMFIPYTRLKLLECVGQGTYIII